MKKVIWNIRSGISIKLLCWALGVAPASEKTSLAIAIQNHIGRIAP